MQHRHWKLKKARHLKLWEAVRDEDHLEEVNRRFFAKVDKNGPTMPHMLTACWEWKGAKGGDREVAAGNKKGYGIFQVSTGHKMGAHQFSVLKECLEILPGHKVLHRCDNPSCVNPKHLRVGTEKENRQDLSMRGKGKCHTNPNLARGYRSERFTGKSKPFAGGRATRQKTLSKKEMARRWKLGIALDLLTASLGGGLLEGVLETQFADPRYALNAPRRRGS